MKPLILLAFLGGAALLAGQSANKSAPEPKFSKLSHEDSGRLRVDAHVERSGFRSDLSLHAIIDGYRLATQNTETSSVPP